MFQGLFQDPCTYPVDLGQPEDVGPPFSQPCFWAGHHAVEGWFQRLVTLHNIKGAPLDGLAMSYVCTYTTRFFHISMYSLIIYIISMHIIQTKRGREGERRGRGPTGSTQPQSDQIRQISCDTLASRCQPETGRWTETEHIDRYIMIYIYIIILYICI